MKKTNQTQAPESFITFARDAKHLDPKVVAQNDERNLLELEHLAQAEDWAKKQPRFKVKQQPKNIVETYEANNLLYIRYEAKIVPKPGGKKKIQGHLPPTASRRQGQARKASLSG